MAAVLYVGEDLCRRIPFMQHGGLTVQHSERSPLAVAAALSEHPRFDAIAFEHDTDPLPQGIFLAARWHSTSPLVLFENPNIARYYGPDHNDDAFDLIIPALTPPNVWVKVLQDLIADARNLRAASHKLRLEAAGARSETRALVRSSKALLRSLRPIDLNAIWRGDSQEDKEPRPTRRPGHCASKRR